MYTLILVITLVSTSTAIGGPIGGGIHTQQIDFMGIEQCKSALLRLQENVKDVKFGSLTIQGACVEGKRKQA